MKKSFRVSAMVLSVLLACSMVVGCGGTTPPAASGGAAPAAPAAPGAAPSGDVITLRWATNSAENDDKNSAAVGGMKAAIKYIEEASKGKMKVQVFWGSQLGNTAEEVLGGCQNGAFEMFSFAHGNWGEYTDALVPFNIPYLFTTQEAVTAFVEGEGAQKVVDKALADTGLRILGLSEYGFRHMTSNKSLIKSPADLKGLKMRTMTDPYQIAAMKTLGVSPTPISWAECFSALQQGVVDAQENPLVNIYTAKLYEVQKYLTLTNHNVSISTIAINENYFQQLPKDCQDILLECGNVCQEASRKQLAEQNDELLEKLKGPECGMEVYVPTVEELKVFQDLVKTSWPAIAKDIGQERFDDIVNTVAEIDKKLGH